MFRALAVRDAFTTSRGVDPSSLPQAAMPIASAATAAAP
jgi:hypothetical protein